MTDKGIVTEVRVVQFWNALAPILVTLYVIPPSVIVLGIVIAPVASMFGATVASDTLVVYKRPLDKNGIGLSANGVRVLKKIFIGPTDKPNL